MLTLQVEKQGEAAVPSEEATKDRYHHRDSVRSEVYVLQKQGGT